MKIGQYNILNNDDKNQLLVNQNRSKKYCLSKKNIHMLFEEQVEKTPNNKAIAFEETHLTYAELNAAANQLAQFILKQYNGAPLPPDTIIALYVDRSIEMIIGILGILKAGAAYVPIDPHYPVDRIRYILEDTQNRLILTLSCFIEELENILPENKQVIILDHKPYQAESTQNLSVTTNDSNLAYVIYTSGTTGFPKGVLQSHVNLVRLFSTTKNYFNFDQDDVWILYHSFVFDFSIWEIWGALIYGGFLVIPSYQDVRDPECLYRLCLNYGVTVLNQTPSAFFSLSRIASPNAQLKLRYIIFGGEALHQYHLKEWKKVHRESGPALINMYGITETTIHATYKLLTTSDKSINIGKLLDDLTGFVLDLYGHPVPIGVVGELYIGGAGLARGYLNQPELTAERFIDNPYASEEDKANGYTKLYKTGDLVRWLPDGNLEYLGRNDFQVKIRGFRIELGEIEQVLSTYPGIRQQVVVAKSKQEQSYLAAYYVAGETLSKEGIVSYLASRLPDYMVPSSFMQLDCFPLTVNGKLDRQALPDPNFEAPNDSYVAPRTELEKQLCCLWQDVLRVGRVGILDDFFRLGGDSILSIQLVAKIRQLGLDCTVKMIFEHRCIEQLAIVLTTELKRTEGEQGLLVGEFGLLPIQSWFFEQKYQHPSHWNQSLLVRVPPLSVQRLESILSALHYHHDMLRARFILNDVGGFEQVYLATVPGMKVYSLNISTLSDAEQQKILTSWQSEFDLAKGPLWQIGYLDGYADGSARLYLAAHHLIVDGVSWRILISDIKQLYEGDVLGEKSSSYRQWVHAIESYGLNQSKEVPYWEDILSKISPAELRPLSVVQRGELALSKEQTHQLLNEAHQAYHTEINDLLLTALGYALQECDGQACHGITLEGHGREAVDDSVDVSSTVGWFTTLYPVWVALQDELGSSIKHIKEYLRAIPNKGLGFGAFHNVLDFGQLPDIRFNYLGQFDSSTGDWQIVPERTGQAVATDNESKLAIDINGWVIHGQLRFDIQLQSERYQALVDAFKRHLIRIIEHCVVEIQAQHFVYTPSDFNWVRLSSTYLDKLVNRYDIEAIYPMNSLQEGFIYHALNAPDDDAYRVQSLCDYEADLDVDRYKQAWILAIQTYPALRLCFDWEEYFIQIISKEGVFDCREHDISTAGNEDEALKILQHSDRLEAFDLKRPSLFRLHIIKRARGYTILKNEHHSIADGWSNPVLLQHVHDYYNQLATDVFPEVIEERSYLQAQAYIAQHQLELDNYWQTQVKSIAVTNDINALLSRPMDLDGVKQVTLPQEVDVTIAGDDYQALKVVLKQLGITMNAFVQLAWHKIVQVYTGDTQTIVGTVTSGRSMPIAGIERSVGLYINTLPLVVDWEGDVTLEKQLQQIHASIVELNSHDFARLTQLQKQGKRLFHSLLIFENYPIFIPEHLPVTFRGTIEKLDYPLSILAFDTGEQLHLCLKYDGAYLEATKASRILSQMKQIFLQIPHQLQSSTSTLSLLSAAEYQEMVHDWNHTEKPYFEDKSIHGWFEEQVARTPEKIAVVFGKLQLTYQELNAHANQLACYIRQHYVNQRGEFKSETMIVVCMERSIDLLISILGILKAGGCYVPVDANYPLERIRYILQDTQANVMLTQTELASRLDDLQELTTLILVDTKPYIQEPKDNLGIDIQRHDLAYVMYTSGSTGKPKGVMVEHKNVVNYYQSIVVYLDETIQSVDFSTNIAFDLTITTTLVPLLAGKKIIIYKGKLEHVDDYLLHLQRAKIDFIKSTPAYLFELFSCNPSFRIKKCFVGGEALTSTHFRCIAEYIDEIYDEYGPTESTVGVLLAKKEKINFKPTLFDTRYLNYKFYILDNKKMPVSFGIVGDLYISGHGLARGYLNKKTLTAQYFIYNEFVNEDERQKGYGYLYKTGDQACWDENGKINLLGRLDAQVKIRGYRIDLSEIESVLEQHESIKKVCVLVSSKPVEDGKNKHLVAYYTVKYEIEKNVILQYLNRYLPVYMIPKKMMVISDFPLTPNGKVDKKALLEINSPVDNAYVAPRNETELLLCDLFQKMFGASSVSIHDDFFLLGGDSILSIQLTTKLKQHSLHCNVADIYKYRTVALLTPKLFPLQEKKINAEQGLLVGSFDLTPIQSWFFQQKFKKENHWNQSFLVRVPILSVKKLNEILPKLIMRHDILRACFLRNATGNVLAQYNDTLSNKRIEKYNINLISKDVFTDWQSQFDISSGELWCIHYVEGYPDGSARIYMAFHHLIIDTISWRILIQDIRSLYFDEELPYKSSSFRQWGHALKNYKDINQTETKFWQKILAKSHINQRVLDEQFTHKKIILNKKITRLLLGEANQVYNTEINELLLTALAYSLEEIDVGEKLITLGGHGRFLIDPSTDVSETVGWFTVRYPVEIKVLNDIGVTIQYMKNYLQQIPNKGLGFGVLMDMRQLPPITFNYLGQFDSHEGYWQVIDEFSGMPIHPENHNSELIAFNGWVVNGQLHFYIATKFGQAITKNISTRFEEYLEIIYTHCLHYTRLIDNEGIHHEERELV